VYIHYVSHSGFPVILASYFKTLNIISHVHGSDVLKENSVSNNKFWLKRLVANWVLSRSDLVVSPSNYYKYDILVPMYSLPVNKVYVSPSGGVDLSKFSQVKKAHKEKVFTLGFIGRLTEDKGTRDFLLLLQQLKDKDVKYKAYIVGDGPLRDEVESFIKNFNLEYTPKLPQDELAKVYNKLDLFIFPTKRKTESLGLVGIEAMACGVPVIAYRVGGPKSYIEQGKNGFIISEGDVSALTESVMNYKKLQEDKKLMIKLNALKTAKKYCSTTIGKDLYSLFNNHLNKKV